VITAGSSPAGGFGHKAHQPNMTDDIANEVRIAKQQIVEYGYDDPRSEAGVSRLAYTMAMTELIRELE